MYLQGALSTLQDYDSAHSQFSVWLQDAEGRLQTTTDAWDLPPPASLHQQLQVNQHNNVFR